MTLLFLFGFCLDTSATTNDQEECTYKLITSMDEITDDDVYLIVGYVSKTVYLMTTIDWQSNRFNSYNHSSDIATLPQTISLDSNMKNLPNMQYLECNIVKQSDGSFIIVNNGNYINHEGNNLVLSSGQGTESKWTIEALGTTDIQRFKIYDKVGKDYYKLGISGSSTSRYFYCSTNAISPNLYKKVFPTYDITIGSTGYSTLYFNSYDMILPDGLEAYTYRVAENEGNGNYALAVSHKYTSGDRIPADCGVVLHGNQGSYSVRLAAPDNTLPHYENLLYGSDESTTTVGDNKLFYKLSRNSAKEDSSIGFYWGSSNGGPFTSNAHKAYLAIGVDVAAKLSSFRFDADIEEQVAGIIHCEKLSDKETSDKLFDLSGRRISRSVKGLKISNGKKFVR